MKEVVLVVALVVLVGLVVLGGAAMFLFVASGDAAMAPEPVAAAHPLAAEEPVLAAPDARLSHELETLRAENADLRRRLEGMETRVASAARQPAEGPVSRAEFEALVADVQRLRRQAQEAGIGSPDRLEKVVADTLKVVRRDETVAKYEAAAARRAEQLEARVAAIADRLGLNAYQRGEVRKIFEARDNAELEVLRLWQSGAPDEQVGEAKIAVQRDYESGMERVLDANQLRQLREGRGGGK